MTILLGLLRVIWLRGMSAVAGAWLNPALAALTVALALGAAATVYALWPSSGNPIGEAVLEAVATREIITNANIDEEKRDNAWIEEYQKWQNDERAAAAKASGPVDRVLWHADDPWLRAKRAAKGR